MEDNNLSNEREEFLKALESSDNTFLSRGKIVKGKVVQFDDTDVFAKLSYKQDYSKALKDKESTLSKIIKPYIE